MTKDELSKTEWAKGLRGFYDKSMELATNPSTKVAIRRTDETGEWLWAIEVVECDLPKDEWEEFWLDALTTKRQAITLCHELGLTVV